MTEPEILKRLEESLPALDQPHERIMPEASGISFRNAAAVLVVRNVDESVAHYRDVLDFRVDFTYGEPAFYAGVERGAVIIHLQAATDTERQPGQAAIYIFVTGVDALYDELRSRGARVLGAEGLPVRHARLRDQGHRR